MSKNVFDLITSAISSNNLSFKVDSSLGVDTNEAEKIEKFVEESVNIIVSLESIEASTFATSSFPETFPAQGLSTDIIDLGKQSNEYDFLFDEGKWNALIEYLGSTRQKRIDSEYGNRTYVKNIEKYLDDIIFDKPLSQFATLPQISKSTIIDDVWQKILFKVIIWISVGKQTKFDQIILPVYLKNYHSNFVEIGQKTGVTFEMNTQSQFIHKPYASIPLSYFKGSLDQNSLLPTKFDQPIDSITKTLYIFLSSNKQRFDFKNQSTRFLFSSLGFFLPWAFFKDLNESNVLVQSFKEVMPFYRQENKLIESFLVISSVANDDHHIVTSKFTELIKSPMVQNYGSLVVILDSQGKFDETEYLQYIQSQMPVPNYQSDESNNLLNIYKFEIYLIHNVYSTLENSNGIHQFDNYPYTRSIYPDSWRNSPTYKSWYFEEISNQILLPSFWPRQNHQESLEDLPPYYLRPQAKILEKFYADLKTSFNNLLPSSIIIRNADFLTLGITTTRTFFRELEFPSILSNQSQQIPLLGPFVTKEHVTAAIFWEDLVRRRKPQDMINEPPNFHSIPPDSNLGIWVQAVKGVLPFGRDRLDLLYDRFIAQLMAFVHYVHNVPKSVVVTEARKTLVSDFVLESFDRMLDNDSSWAKPWLSGIFTGLQPTLNNPSQFAQPTINTTPINTGTLTASTLINQQAQQRPQQTPLTTITFIPVTSIPQLSSFDVEPRQRRSNPRKVSSLFRKVRRPKRKTSRRRSSRSSRSRRSRRTPRSRG